MTILTKEEIMKMTWREIHKYCFNYSDCFNCSHCSDCFNCFNCSDCFYKILNVQFTKEEYEKKVAEK